MGLNLRHTRKNKFLFESALVFITLWSTLIAGCDARPVPTEAPSPEETMPRAFSLPYADFIIGETTEEDLLSAFGRSPDRLETVAVGGEEVVRLCYEVESDLFLDCFYLTGGGVLQFLQAYLPESADITTGPPRKKDER